MYRVRDTNTDEQMAMKKLVKPADNELAMEEVKNEIWVMDQLSSHPSICQLYTWGVRPKKVGNAALEIVIMSGPNGQLKFNLSCACGWGTISGQERGW